MTNLPRVTGKIFAESASATGNNPEIGKFGNAKQQIYTGEADISEIQNSEAWSQGWTSAVVSNSNFPPLPEMNGVLKNLSQQICYILQKGIAEWDKNTIYYENNYVNYNGKLYRSKIDNNTTEPGTEEGIGNWSTSELDVSIATLYEPGIVQPDGKTITIDDGGVISSTLKVDIATTEKPGIVQPDGKTITIDEGGVISISPDFFSEADDGVTPSVCTGLTKVVKDNQVLLKWTDPEDTILNGKVVASWGGTMIVKKQGSYPINEEDGELVINSTIAQQYKKEALVDTVDIPDNWYYKAFPYSTYNKFTYNDKNCFTNAIIYEFTIDPNNSDSLTRVEYPEGSQNSYFKPAYMDFEKDTWVWGDWSLDNFFMPKPCMLKVEGDTPETRKTKFQYYLNIDDYSKKLSDDSPSEVANTTEIWQAMAEIPQIWLKFTNDEDTGFIHVYISNRQVDEQYHCYTHYNADGDLVPYIYTQLYNPKEVNSIMRSISGQNAQTYTQGLTVRTWTKNNGAGWDFLTFGQWMLYQVLTILVTKSTSTTKSIGLGIYTSGSGEGDPAGGLNKKGYFYGRNANKSVKVFGTENLYGDYHKLIVGLHYSANGLLYKLSEDMSDGSGVVGYNTTGENYLSFEPITGGAGYLKNMKVNEKGMFPHETGGSTTTYFCNYTFWLNGGMARVGGAYYGGGDTAGLYVYDINQSVQGQGVQYGFTISFVPRERNWKEDYNG